MKTKSLFVLAIVLFVAIVAGFAALFLTTRPATPTPNPGGIAATTTNETRAIISDRAEIDNIIEVTAPLKNAAISSPLAITGNARGAWYFEASAPVELRDANGAIIAQGHIQAQGDWMTDDFVPFKATLTFAKPTTTTGTLVLKNDNPSGDPSRQQELDIPVKF